MLLIFGLITVERSLFLLIIISFYTHMDNRTTNCPPKFDGINFPYRMLRWPFSWIH